LTVAATLLILPLVSGRDPVETRIDVLWQGAAAMAAACAAATIVGPTTSGALRPPTRFVDDYREGVTVVRTRSWYRLFLATQIVFVPISLSMTFFSLRAAMAHADKAGSVHVLVISSAAGLLAGSFLWRRVFSRCGVRGMLVMSGTISSAAALVCLANEVIPDREQLWVHSVVFFLATLANAAIGAATVSWISAFATEDRRAMLISFAAALAAVVSAVLGAVLGTIAQATVAPWPVMIVLALAVLATTVAIRAPDRPPAT
jgi:MFS family permease